MTRSILYQHPPYRVARAALPQAALREIGDIADEFIGGTPLLRSEVVTPALLLFTLRNAAEVRLDINPDADAIERATEAVEAARSTAARTTRGCISVL